MISQISRKIVASSFAVKGAECSYRFIYSHTTPRLVSQRLSSKSILRDAEQSSAAFRKKQSTSENTFHFDPPYTPVPGELEAFNALNGQKMDHLDGSSERCARHRETLKEEMVERVGNLHVLYTCRACKAPLFSSYHMHTKKAGELPPFSPWPTFTGPITSKAIKYRNCLQKRTFDSSIQLSTSLASRPLPEEKEGGISRSRRQPLNSRRSAPSLLEITLQQKRLKKRYLNSVSPSDPTLRGPGLIDLPQSLTVSGSRKGKKKWNMSWRERCLRDEHQRADPVYTEGCCQRCGLVVCRVLPTHGGNCYAKKRNMVVHESEREVALGTAQEMCVVQAEMGLHVSTGSALVAVLNSSSS